MSEQYKNLVEILGFDPESDNGMAKNKPGVQQDAYNPDILTQILGFNPVTGSRLDKKQRLQLVDKTPDDVANRFFDLQTDLLQLMYPRHRIAPSDLLSIFDSGRSIVRNYHAWDPLDPVSLQTFPIARSAEFVKDGTFYRPKRLSQKHPDDKPGLTIEFTDNISTSIYLKDTSGEEVAIYYRDKEPAQYARPKNGSPFEYSVLSGTKDLLEVTLNMHKVYFPNKIDRKELTGTLFENPSLYLDPYMADAADDTPWREIDLEDLLKIKVTT
jgi:hypothetical protein